MTDWVAIFLRAGLYCDLMLLFGLTAWPLHAPSPSPPAHRTVIFAALAALGLVLSAAGFIVMTADMAGVPIADLDGETLRFVTMDTAAGNAFLARMAALALATGLAFAGMGQPARWLLAAAAAAALATLAWTGHAAVTEGLPGSLHRLSDAIHLLAAAAWIGALVMLLGMLASPLGDKETVADARRALAGFAVAGSVLVALILVTGLINLWMIVGPRLLPLLPHTAYGQLLIAKLLLFAVMLACAGANRWRLTPRLEAAAMANDVKAAARALRTSIALEASAAALILFLVAWLGTLAPPSAL